MPEPLYGRSLDRRGLAARSGDPRVAGGVRAVTLDDGDGRGVRLLEFRTAAGLDADVLVDRAMDLGELRLRGRNLAFLSPTGVRHPAYHHGEEEDGLGFLRSFTGALVTVGLDHAFGPAESDAQGYAYPGRSRVVHGLHGRIANLPARLTGYGELWDDAGEACTLWAEGVVRQAAVFGEHLELRRRIEAPLHGAGLRIVDVVANHGFEPARHRLLWHVDFGWPLVDDATLLRLPAESGAAARQIGPLGPPVAGRAEEVTALRPAAQDAWAEARIVNPMLGLGARLRWRVDAMPAFLLWSHLRAGAYAVGFEPSTHAIGDRSGSHGQLRPGEARRYELELEAADGDVARGWIEDGV
jgi:hypothetical protein